MMDLGRGRGGGRSLWVVLGFLVALELCGLASGNVVFKVRHKFAGRGRSLGDFKAHDSHRHRRILSAVDMPLGGDGSPTGVALYYTSLGIGTPPKDYHVQIDTGSDILWVNCVGCDNCPKKSNLGIKLRLYDVKESTSGQLITCDQDFCTNTFNAPYADCKVGMQCQYAVTYGDGSTTAGYFVRDAVTFQRASGNLQTSPANGSVAFGCGAKQSGELGSATEAVDGILGFGQANSSMISQLALAGKVKKIFSHCLDGNNGGGIFAIGEVVQPKLNSTPLVQHESHYNVIMTAVEVGGEVLDLPTDLFDTGARRGTIIDSGTTLAYLPDEVFNQLMKKIQARQPNLETHVQDEQFTCFSYTENVDAGFPVVTFHFEDSLSLTVYPHDYLFEVGDGAWCFGWQNSGIQTKDGKEITLLGDLVLSNKLVVYDLENQTIGWTEYNCSSSIKVKDEQTGQVHLVGAHDLSSASSLNTGKLLVLVLMAILYRL